jgi:hypothetical protein
MNQVRRRRRRRRRSLFSFVFLPSLTILNQEYGPLTLYQGT